MNNSRQHVGLRETSRGLQNSAPVRADRGGAVGLMKYMPLPVRKFAAGVALSAVGASCAAHSDDDALNRAPPSVVIPGSAVNSNACLDTDSAPAKFAKIPLDSCAGCHSAKSSVVDARRAWIYDDGTNGAEALKTAFETSSPTIVKEVGPDGAVNQNGDGTGKPFWVLYPQGLATQAFDKEKGVYTAGNATGHHMGGVQQLTKEQIEKMTQLSSLMTNVKAGTKVDLNVNVDCKTDIYRKTPEEFFQGIKMLNLSETFAKYRRMTGGLMPDQNPGFDEMGEGALAQFIYENIDSPEFSSFFLEEFNRMTLTDFYATKKNSANSFLGSAFGAPWEVFDTAELARGPGNLFLYLMINGFDIRQLLTANFLVVPGIRPADAGPDEAFQKRLSIIPAQEGQHISGIATDPLLLGRLPTSFTNRWRKRAWWTLKNFHDKDVLQENSTRNILAPKGMKDPEARFPGCNQCHAVIDRLAMSAFYYNKSDKFEYTTDYPSEFLGMDFENLHGIQPGDPNSYEKFMSYLSRCDFVDWDSPNPKNLDPKIPYAKSIAKIMFGILLGRQPLVKPQVGAENFDALMTAWMVEDTFLKEVGMALIQGGYNAKAIIPKIVLSPFFRATNEISEEPSKDRAIELAEVGPHRALARTMGVRLRQLFGDHVFTGNNGSDIMSQLDSLKIMLGDIDSVTVTITHGEVSPQSYLAKGYIAGQMDRLVQMDLALPPAQRALFVDLDWGTDLLQLPEYPSGEQINNGVNKAMYLKQLIRIWARNGKYLDLSKIEDQAFLDSEYQKLLGSINACANDPTDTRKVASQNVPKGGDADDAQCIERGIAGYMATVALSPVFDTH